MEELTKIQEEKREMQQLLKKELERLQKANDNLQDNVIQTKGNVEPELIIADNIRVMCEIYNTIYQ